MSSNQLVASGITVLSTSSYRPEEAASVSATPPPVPIEVSEPRYSIRLAKKAGTCALCIEPTGTGPVGYLDEEPVCDLCLLKSSVELGMVLALIAVTREYGAFNPKSEEEWREALAELGGFARVYERFASRSGPRRPDLRPDGSDDSAAN